MAKTKSVIVEWMMAYIIVLMIPMITIFINYTYNVKVLEQEIYDSNELVLNNLADGIDAHLQEEKEFCNYIMTNKMFTKLITYEETSPWFYYDASEVYTQISDYRQLRSMSYLIYLDGADYVMGDRGCNSSLLYYNSREDGLKKQLSYPEWISAMGTEAHNSFHVGKFLDSNMLQDSLIYANSYYWPGHEKVSIFISMPISEIEGLAEGLEPGTTLVISRDEELLLAVSCEGVVGLPDSRDFLKSTENMFETEEHMVVNRRSAEDGITYSMLVTKREFWKEFQYVRNFFFVSLILTFFVGLICVRLLVKRNFNPLSSLYTKMKDVPEEGNEFQQMEKVYNRLLDENKDMKKRIVVEKESLQSYYLFSLMKGHSSWLQNGVEKVPVLLEPGESVAMVAFYVPVSTDGKKQVDELLLFALDNIFSELIEKEKFYRMQEGRYLFYLFGVMDNAGWRDAQLERIQFLYEFLEEKYGYSILAVISGWESDLKKINHLYETVTEILEKKYMLGGTGIVDAQEWCRNTGIVNEIIDYIEQHYMEDTLNINSLADGIQRNPQYISKVFKSETGKSILDYIHSLRIRRAQLIMRSGKYSLKEVSEIVGYANFMTFRRAFEKNVGMTPGKYKEEEGI